MSNDLIGADVIIVQKRLVYKTYIRIIENSIGTNMFRSSFGVVQDEHVDLTKDGELSCAFFVSSILKLCDYIDTPHLTVRGTVNDLIQNEWKEIETPSVGSVLVWKKFEILPKVFHEHIGFYIGNGKIISNDSRKGYPIEHNFEKEKDKIDKILSHSSFVRSEDC